MAQLSLGLAWFLLSLKRSCEKHRFAQLLPACKMNTSVFATLRWDEKDFDSCTIALKLPRTVRLP
jgi:hypothetical protein